MAKKPLALTEAERRAFRMIPVWEKGKELYNVDHVARMFAQDTTMRKVWTALSQTMTELSAKSVSSLRLMGLPDAPAHYPDRKRSIPDIRNEFAVQYGPMDVEALILRFQAFEEAGPMKLIQK